MSCQINVLQYLLGADRDVVVAELQPEIPLVASLLLHPGDYSLRAQATRFLEYREPLSVDGPRMVDMKLAPEPAGQVAGVGTEAVGESQGTLANLTVRSDDPSAFIAIWDSDRAPRGSAQQSLSLRSIAGGIYRARMFTPEGATVEQLIDVPASGEINITMDAPGPRVGTDQLQMLSDRGIDAHDGYLHPSERLSAFANASLASLLSFAAFAAHWPDIADFQRLRAFGVTPARVKAGESALLVLIGASGDAPVKDASRDQFLDNSEVSVRDLDGSNLGLGGFSRLRGFEAAAQAHVGVAPGSMTLELRLPKLAPTRYALAALKDRVTVLVVVVEDSGEVDVQQYLLPVRGTAGFMDFLSVDPANIRRLELAQRFYANGTVLEDAGTMEGMLYGKWLDPLLGCIGGYELIRSGQSARYVGSPNPEARHDQQEPSAMRNMLKFFDRLPDSHVLAALAEPERRDEHFANALDRGLPVFAEGFQALRSWSLEQPDRKRPLWVQQSAILPGSPWTAWVAFRPAILISRGSFAAPPPGWAVLEDHRSAIEATFGGVGKLTMRKDDVEMPMGTGFLVGPRMILTASYAAALAFKTKSGRWPRRPAYPMAIDFGGEVGQTRNRTVGIETLLAVDQKNHLALLQLEATPPTPRAKPLALARDLALPHEGRRIYVVGFPFWDQRVPESALMQAFSDIYEVKRLQPGQTLHVPADEDLFSHDCFTLGGNGGSPVVDIETGRVIGLHYSGRWIDDKQGDAIALWKLAGTKLFSDAGIAFT